jgi:predicted protein tyrosine phosphatase
MQIDLKPSMSVPDPLRILFVCGRNKWRSPTAERIYREDSRVSVRSAGVSEKSGHKIGRADLEWADLVLVMERRYAARIRSDFRELLNLPPIESLDIPDDYGLMDPVLIALLRGAVEHHINASRSNPSPGATFAPVTVPAAPAPRRR